MKEAEAPEVDPEVEATMAGPMADRAVEAPEAAVLAAGVVVVVAKVAVAAPEGPVDPAEARSTTGRKTCPPAWHRY